MNQIDIVNEGFVLIVCYHLLCFTDFVVDPAVRVAIGWSLIILTSVNLLANQGFGAYWSAKGAYLKCKRK